MEIDLAQPPLDFDAAPRPASGRRSALSVPVASLIERARAALIDMTLMFFAFGSFLAIFSLLGGQWERSKTDLVVTVAVFALFYSQYFTLFIFCGGATPGMRMYGLRVAAFDGSAPAQRHLMRRSVGYVLSGSTLLLGFMWSLWDDDGLSWHDHISQTCLVKSAAGAQAQPKPFLRPASQNVRG
jgi:uncharacterized RDD family membrane protein YckC